MKRKLITLLLIPYSVMILTGCWSATELDELGITAAIGIDKVDDKFIISVQLINPSEIAAANRTSELAVNTHTIEAETFFEAVRKMTTESPRKIYTAHVRMIVLGEELARDGILQVLDFLSRDHEFRTDFFLTVAKNEKAENILKIITPLETIPANNMYSSLDVSEKVWAPTKGVHLDELITTITSDGINPTLTGIIIKGDASAGNRLENLEHIKSPSILKYDGIAAFKGDKLVGWMNTEESKGFNDITDNVTNTVIGLPCEEGKVVIEAFQFKTNVTGQIKKYVPKINIESIVEANIGEVKKCKIDLSKKESIDELQKRAAEIIEDNMEQAISKAKEFESDIFGFGEAIHRNDPKGWKKIKDQWDEAFKEVDVEIKVDVKIRRPGTIVESFQE